MNNPFDYIPDPECADAFARLLEQLERLRLSSDGADRRFIRELDAGKMLGVLIAADAAGCHHALYAFSGQIAGDGFNRPGFVEPVFDYLSPSGYFKIHEADISRQSLEIARFQKDELAAARSEFEAAKERTDADVAQFREICRKSKAARDARRKSGPLDERLAAAMIRESQFEKAELLRRKKSAAAALLPFQERLQQAEYRLLTMKERRRADSEALQKWLFDNFRVLDARGRSRSLTEIFAATPVKVPPSGAGECCAPKLLQAAYTRGWTPLKIAEYWYGASKEGEVRIHGHHYPACRGKCRPVLGWMLGGMEVSPPLHEVGLAESCADLRILYENRWFCVVDKPAGVLSVPGKTDAVSVQEWLAARYGDGKAVRMAHRLDQHTSGLLVATFGDEAYRVMQRLFATRQVRKTYVALLNADTERCGLPDSGRISLPLAPDWLDRPRQRVDFERGKEAVTDYEFAGMTGRWRRVLFHPVTGRTHQLRVHAASRSGLGMPIAGDPLYGVSPADDTRRMMLHAASIAFTFPLDGGHYVFESPVPF